MPQAEILFSNEKYRFGERFVPSPDLGLSF